MPTATYTVMGGSPESKGYEKFSVRGTSINDAVMRKVQDGSIAPAQDVAVITPKGRLNMVWAGKNSTSEIPVGILGTKRK